MSLPRAARKIIFWVHLSAGLAAGLVILLQAVTGILLAFERQILDWGDGYTLAVDAERAELPLEEIAAQVLARQQGPPLSAISREAGPDQPLVFIFGKEKQVFVDPHDGKVLGEGAPRLRGFFAFITGLHRWLALQESGRELGKAITGAAALIFLFMILSGLCLWWPRRWTWQHLKRIVLFQPRFHGPARHWNWHHVIGFWLCVPLLIITLSGVIMSYDWANGLLFRLAGSPPPPPKAEGSGGGGGRGKKGGGAGASTVSLAGLNQAWALAEGKVANWQSINVRLPGAAGVATFTISAGHRGRADLKSQLMVNLGTGAVTAYETFENYPRGKQWRFWTRWIHTGEAGGILGQVVALIAAVGAVFLVLTGFALTWRRFRRR